MSFYDIPWEIFNVIIKDFTFNEKIYIMSVCETWKELIGSSITEINRPIIELSYFPNITNLTMYNKYDIRYFNIKHLDLSYCNVIIGNLPKTLEHLVCSKYVTPNHISKLTNLKTIKLCHCMTKYKNIETYLRNFKGDIKYFDNCPTVNCSNNREYYEKHKIKTYSKILGFEYYVYDCYDEYDNYDD